MKHTVNSEQQTTTTSSFSWLAFVFKSIALGIVIAVCVLILIPQLRHEQGIALNLFDSENQFAEKLSYYDAVSRAAPAVVNIYTQSTEYRASSFGRRPIEITGLGSGVIMRTDGYILTCYHVVNRADAIIVSLQDGRISEARIVGFDPLTDLAVLKVAATNLPVIPQSESSKARVGDVVLAIGNPYDLGQTITQGIVSRTGRNGLANFSDFIQMDAAINKGSSGGALVDSNGQLMGINNATFNTRDRSGRPMEVDGVSFAVPYSLAKRVMDQIIDKGKVTRGQLGFTATAKPDGSGFYVSSVFAGGAAEKAGMHVGDTLLAMAGKPFTSIPAALDLAADATPGSSMEIKVGRDNQTLTITAVVLEFNPNQR